MFELNKITEPEDIFHKAKDFFKEEEEERKKFNREKKKKIHFYIAVLFLIIILAPLILLGTNIVYSFLQFEKIQKAIQSSDFVSIQQNSKSLEKSIGLTQRFLDFSNHVLSPFGQEEKIEKLKNFFLFGEKTAGTLYEIALTTYEGEKIFRKVILGEEVPLEENLADIKVSLGTAFEETSLSSTLLSEFSGNEFLLGRYVLQAKKFLPEVRKNLLTVIEATEVIPDILGSKERKTYLVLFQNNMELRPTGGFIGSYGLVTFDKGKLLDFEIYDVYFADGQLKGHVEPPAKVREFLGASGGWYLRDSNWDPDFPTSAQRAGWFLDKETGRKVNGVIGVDLTVAQRILEAVGEIQLPDYKEKISSKNFFERAEYWSEAGFFPGSTGKQDFLGQVGRVLFEEIKRADEKTLASVFRAILISLEEKDLIIWLEDPKGASFLTKFNFDGAIKTVKCKGQTVKCLEDYLLVVEANVGINKSNYFLKRSLEQTIKVGEDGRVSRNLTINYENQSPSEVFPAGKYKNYLRIYVPEGSTPTECKIDNVECQIERTNEHNKEVFGFLVEVPVGEKRRVQFSWSLPGIFEEGEYILLTQKQPGTKNDDFSLSFSYPHNLGFLEIQPSALTGEGMIVYNTTLSSDLLVRADFVKK